MLRSSLSQLFALVAICFPACQDPPARTNPMLDARVLPPAGVRASVRREATLVVAPVSDERAAQGAVPSEADVRLEGAAARLVGDYLVRELGRASLFVAVRPDDGRVADLRLECSLLQFRGEARGNTIEHEGSGEVQLRARLIRTSDSKVLLQQVYSHQCSESRLVERSDPLAIACSALARVVAELLTDLDVVDVAAP